MLKPNIQLFAEGDPQNGDPATNTPPTGAGDGQTPTHATGGPEPTKTAERTFSAEYVSDLREEAKSHRLRANGLEEQLRKALGIGESESLGDVSKRIEEQQAQNTKAVNDAIAEANRRIITAEVKSMNDYDSKLLLKLLDRSKITVDEDGTIKGLQEAVEETEKEYPAVRINKPGKYSAGTGNAPVGEKYGKEMLAFRSASGLKND